MVEGFGPHDLISISSMTLGFRVQGLGPHDLIPIISITLGFRSLGVRGLGSRGIPIQRVGWAWIPVHRQIHYEAFVLSILLKMGDGLPGLGLRGVPT